MISKGTQYLSAAGFGNIRVTAASMGSAWIMCPWLLSGAACNAILGAFGADGAAVIAATNAYLNAIAAQGAAGKTKATALAGFINEDPMMVCSLGLEPEGVAMPIRWLRASGSQYIDTGWVPSGRDFELQLRFIPKAIGSWAAVYGTYWTDGGLDNLYQNGTLFLYTANTYVSSMPVYVVGTEYEMIHSYSKIKRTNGNTTIEVNSGASSDFTTSRPLWLFGSQNFNKFNGAIAEYIRRKDGVDKQYMYPFIRKIDGVDKLGMIDVLSDTFYQNAGSGSFTIEYTLPDGTPWTPSTP